MFLPALLLLCGVSLGERSFLPSVKGLEEEKGGEGRGGQDSRVRACVDDVDCIRAGKIKVTARSGIQFCQRMRRHLSPYMLDLTWFCRNFLLKVKESPSLQTNAVRSVSVLHQNFYVLRVGRVLVIFYLLVSHREKPMLVISSATYRKRHSGPDGSTVGTLAFESAKRVQATAQCQKKLWRCGRSFFLICTVLQVQSKFDKANVDLVNISDSVPIPL